MCLIGKTQLLCMQCRGNGPHLVVRGKSHLIAVANTSKAMLNSGGESGHPCLVPDFRGNAFNFSPLRVMLAVGWLYIAFIMLSYVPSIPTFWRVLIINEY